MPAVADGLDQRAGDLGAGRVAAGVRDAAAVVAALAGELDLAGVGGVSKRAPVAISRRTASGPSVTSGAHGLLVAQPGARDEGVVQVLLGGVALAERGGDAALRPAGGAVVEPGLGDDDGARARRRRSAARRSGRRRRSRPRRRRRRWPSRARGRSAVCRSRRSSERQGDVVDQAGARRPSAGDGEDRRRRVVVGDLGEGGRVDQGEVVEGERRGEPRGLVRTVRAAARTASAQPGPAWATAAVSAAARASPRPERGGPGERRRGGLGAACSAAGRRAGRGPRTAPGTGRAR